jgi:hypothetical protein
MKPRQPVSHPSGHVQLPLGLTPSESLEEAVRSTQALLVSDPNNLSLLNQLGALYLAQGRPEEGIGPLEKSLRISPDQFATLSDYASGLGMLGRFQASLEIYERVIALNPDYVMAHYNRGLVLQILNHPGDALASFERAIALDPNCAPAHNNRGNILKGFNRLEEALESYDRVLALHPAHAEAHNNRGTVLQELHRLEDALAAYDQALFLNPSYPAAHLNKSLLKLLTGNYEEGWRLYEWRWKADQKTEYRNFTQPLWLGEESLKDRTLLVQAEQGLGDMLQFCRYVPMLHEMGVKVILETPHPLVSILSTLTDHLTVIEKGSPLPVFDYYCPVMSLPLAFKTTGETIPVKTPYLFADPSKISVWQKRLGAKTRPRIALAWSGNVKNTSLRNRSVALEDLTPLLNLPFEFHSLQTEYRGNDKSILPTFPQIHDHQSELKDFSDTAGLVSEMDLIISVDTSVAHLTGALGKPLWVLLPFTTSFRWLLDRSDSPWYPTATLFRQSTQGDWSTVISKVVCRIQKEFK